MAMRRGLREHRATLELIRGPTSLCQPCLRHFATTATAQAGHNKWSKTKHIKAATDKKKMADRNTFIKAIAMYSRLYGEDADFNPKLAQAISAASKASVPKSLIEGAIARGQGRSATGAQLESMMFEALIPPNFAIIAEAETDNKNRTLGDLKLVVKNSGGLTSSTGFYFTKRGRAIFGTGESARISLSDFIEEAIELDGMEDVEELADGGFLVWTQPTKLAAIIEVLGRKLEVEVLDSDIVWAPNEETLVQLDSPETAEKLESLCAGMKEYPEVKSLFANIKRGQISDDEWDKVSRHLDI